METIGTRIKRLREADGKTQQDIADMLVTYGIKTNREAVAKWEAGKDGKNIPVVSTIMALSHIFGVTSDYLIEGLNNNSVSIKPNEAEIIKAIRLNPHIAHIIDCAKDMTPDQIETACRVVCSLIDRREQKLS
jgi:transcriptional regulator with XRE-family HTH domain